MPEQKIFMDNAGRVVDAKDATQCIVVTTDDKGAVQKREYYFTKDYKAPGGNPVGAIADQLR